MGETWRVLATFAHVSGGCIVELEIPPCPFGDEIEGTGDGAASVDACSPHKFVPLPSGMQFLAGSGKQLHVSVAWDNQLDGVVASLDADSAEIVVFVLVADGHRRPSVVDDIHSFGYTYVSKICEIIIN